jgi:predicted phosphoadenosine phosphosulfate sulfurtransferase
MKLYLTMNTYQAAMHRIDYVFKNFDNIYVSFSGGKDSAMVLNLCLKYMREHGITRKIGVFHQDFEAQFTATTGFVEHTLTSNLDLIEPYWVCLPMSCKTATSMFEQYWQPWEQSNRDIWVRDMPNHYGVININNQQFDFYEEGMLQEDLYEAFTGWYHRHVGKGRGKTIGLVGLRTQESLNRWRAATEGKYMHDGLTWTTQSKGCRDAYSGYPIFDWVTEDIWTANAKLGFGYNRLYDLFHYAGISIHDMRVASPFNDWAIGSLKLYRVIEPHIWGKMIGRVNGANFCAIYGGTSAVAWKNIKLPKGHTWRSYVDFLLKTLPEDTRKTYEEKFATSFEFWLTKGGVLSTETIDELRAMGVKITVHGKTKYRTDKDKVTFEKYPDDLDVKEFQSVPTYKRMAICILKNDHLCKYMGFSQTQRETQKRKEAIAKYMAL